MKIKSQVLNSETVGRTIARISHEICERNDGAENLVILGVKSRGVPFAQRIATNIKSFENVVVPTGELDITLQRDDYSEEKKKELATESIIPCDITDKTVLVVDDVLYTGRTAKAAIETIFKYGRPKAVQLAVFVDRGHRELPIRPDYVGKNIPTSKTESIAVRFEEVDGETAVYIME